MPIPEHPLICGGDPQIIETDAALAEFVDHSRSVGRFAYDTEFIGELSYHPRLCLIQLATHERLALVDPLAGVDLEPVWAMVADPAIQTLVHAGGQDFEPVFRLHGGTPANIFDTQIAAGFCGLSYPVGLGRLIEELLDLRLGKGLTFTHWDHRPLSAVHARYAADDVRFLPALHDLLLGDLRQRGHEQWAALECQAQAEAASRERDAETLYRRIRGVHQLRPRKLAVLRALTVLRDMAAREHDVPPRSLVKDTVLLDLARNPVASVDKLAKVPGLPRRFAQAYGESIISVTRQALDLPKESLPAPPPFEKESPGVQVRVDALNALASNLCYARQIAPSLAVNRRDVAELYDAFRHDRHDPDHCRLMQGWRRALVGGPLVDVLQGRSSVRLWWAEGQVRAEVRGPDGRP